MKVLLLRHGEIPSNVKKIYAGRSHEGLTERGIGQVKEAAKQLRDYTVQAFYSSPIERAVQTARIIGDEAGVNFEPLHAFREMELGPWEGLSEKDVARLYPDEWQVWQTRPADLRLPGRETLDELLARVLKGIQDIFRLNNGKTVMIVTHVAIIRVLILWHTRQDLNLYKSIEVPNAKVFQLRIDEVGV